MENYLLEAVTLALLLMLCAHYVAGRVAGRRLHRVACYVAGTAIGYLLPYAYWTWRTGADWTYFAALVLVTAGAGAGTIIGYMADNYGGAMATRDDE